MPFRPCLLLADEAPKLVYFQAVADADHETVMEFEAPATDLEGELANRLSIGTSVFPAERGRQEQFSDGCERPHPVF
jgi:hypothetical protein